MSAPENGIPLGDPDEFRELTRRVRELLGCEVVDAAIRSRKAEETGLPALGVFDSVLAFSRVDEWSRAIASKTALEDPIGYLRFAMMCRMIVRCSQYENANVVLAEMRSALAANDMDKLEKALFEMEVAAYWLDQMMAVDVGFAAKAGHPDVWAIVDVGAGRVRVAIECKRVQPTSTELRNFQAEAERVEKRFRAISDAHGGLRCLAWTSDPLSAPDEDLLVALIHTQVAGLAADAPPERWVTASDPVGRYRISASRLGQTNEGWTSASITADIPVEPILVVRSVAEHRPDGVVTSRLQSVFGYRTDALPDRIGGLGKNIGKALGQLQQYSPNEIGCVAVRMRRPTALGDLWESDRVARRLLEASGDDQVSAAILMWDEGQLATPDGDLSAAANEPVKRLATYSLRPYFVANRLARLRMDHIDSQKVFFPDPPQAFVRDPIAGDIRPISQADFDAIEAGADVPQVMLDALAAVGEAPEDEGSATIYWRLYGSLNSEMRDVVIGLVRAGGRQFRIFLDKQCLLRVIEVTGRAVKARATIDLRAWLDEEELCLSLTWKSTGFTASLEIPDTGVRVYAKSAEVRAHDQ